MALDQYISERRATLDQNDRPAMIMTHVVCGYPSFEDNWKELEIMDEFDNNEDMRAVARKNWEKRAKSLGIIE